MEPLILPLQHRLISLAMKVVAVCLLHLTLTTVIALAKLQLHLFHWGIQAIWQLLEI